MNQPEKAELPEMNQMENIAAYTCEHTGENKLKTEQGPKLEQLPHRRP